MNNNTDHNDPDQINKNLYESIANNLFRNDADGFKDTPIVKKCAMMTYGLETELIPSGPIGPSHNVQPAVAKQICNIKEPTPEFKGEKEPPLSFISTERTCASPFFPMKLGVKLEDREFGKVIQEKTWGRITMEGIKLSLSDARLLLVLLSMVKEQKTDVIKTTLYILCKKLELSQSGQSYQSIRESLKAMHRTSITTERNTKKERATIRQTFVNHIIAAFGFEEEEGNSGQKKDQLVVKLDRYFLQMHGEEFVTGLDMDTRKKCPIDTGKQSIGSI